MVCVESVRNPERCSSDPGSALYGAGPFDAKDPDATFLPIEPLRPPEGAPNVLVVLLDDVGFAASSAFGGPCATPTADRLAGQGLKYNRFHTTALCSPTRAALLTGRNHHTVGMGVITELATSAPGYNSLRPNTCAPLRRHGHERVLDRTVRQMPRGAGLADQPAGPVRRIGRPAAASSTSTASSAARRTNTTPRSTKERLQSSRENARRRATTSPRT